MSRSEALPTRRVAGRRRTVLRLLLIGLAISLLGRFVVTGLPEVRDAAGLVLSQRSPLLAMAIAIEVLWLYALSQVYRSALKAFRGRVSRQAALRISMAAFTLSRVLPGGGAAGSVFAARELVRAGNSVLSVVTSMVAAWWVSMSVLSVIVLSGAGWSVLAGDLAPVHLGLPAAVLAALVFGGVVGAQVHRRGLTRSRLGLLLTGYVLRLDASVPVDPGSLGEATKGLRTGRFTPVAGWAALSWVCDAAALWLAFAAFGYRLSPGPLLIGFGLANLISALPELTPGWLGVLEAALSVTYAAFGVPAGTAVVAVLAYRLVSYWLPVAVGVPAALTVFRRSARTDPEPVPAGVAA